MTEPGAERIEAAYQFALQALLAERNADGYWTGELSSSALSTATAISALALVQKQTGARSHGQLIANGLAWLATHQNADGGWGDTVKSFSNISTSMLCRAALHLTGATEQYADKLRRVEAYLLEKCGRTPAEQAEAVRARYGKDRTFAVPILTTCALAGFIDWSEVTPLPFELACFPQSWFRFLRLPVVSYALPALIAIGQAVYHHRPPRNPLTRLVRRLALAKSLRVLQAIQPSSGGYLEATPLTSFVTLSLASIGRAEHPVAKKGVGFLASSARPDGSWAIDSNLSVWLTTLAANALASAGADDSPGRTDLATWIAHRQFTDRHPFTGSEPGGWGWTHLPGSVPDGDDTPGALLALAHVAANQLEYFMPRISAGIYWLTSLQNRDGGWPTFCRGWGRLPFDRSGTDLTAHALRALSTWSQHLRGSKYWHDYPIRRGQTHEPSDYLYSLAVDERAIPRGMEFLQRQQRPDGSWLPLWFGNQHAPNDENPTYGTARVLAAYRDLDMMNSVPARRGVAWLLSVQNADGGWGGAKDTPSSVEETALAVEVLLGAGAEAELAVNKGLAWLVEQVESGGLCNPTPIGFYFAKLWYFEKLYPIIFTVAALGRARRYLSTRRD